MEEMKYISGGEVLLLSLFLILDISDTLFQLVAADIEMSSYDEAPPSCIKAVMYGEVLSQNDEKARKRENRC